MYQGFMLINHLRRFMFCDKLINIVTEVVTSTKC